MATHSSILVCRIPWTEEPGGLQSMGSQRVWHDWATNISHAILFKTHFYLYSLVTPGLSCPEIQVPDISNFFCQQIRPLSCLQKNFAPQIAWIQPDEIPESFTPFWIHTFILSIYYWIFQNILYSTSQLDKKFADISSNSLHPTFSKCSAYVPSCCCYCC